MRPLAAVVFGSYRSREQCKVTRHERSHTGEPGSTVDDTSGSSFGSNGSPASRSPTPRGRSSRDPGQQAGPGPHTTSGAAPSTSGDAGGGASASAGPSHGTQSPAGSHHRENLGGPASGGPLRLLKSEGPAPVGMYHDGGHVGAGAAGGSHAGVNSAAHGLIAIAGDCAAVPGAAGLQVSPARAAWMAGRLLRPRPSPPSASGAGGGSSADPTGSTAGSLPGPEKRGSADEDDDGSDGVDAVDDDDGDSEFSG
jgi:hypothetical protein